MKKKIIICIIFLLIVSGIGGIAYFVLNKEDKNNLTIIEKQWIQNNKNNIIDIDIENDISIFSNDGEGLIYEFLTDLEKDTELGFNKIPLSDEKTSDYSVQLTKNADKNDIVIYEDNYALITKSGSTYNDLNDINNLIIGVLAEDLEDVKYYLNDETLTFVPYDSSDLLLQALLGEEVSEIILPKTKYLKTILENKLIISYNITEMKQNLVIKLGKEKKLNTILKKYYEKWFNNKYEESFNKNLSINYYDYTEVEDDTQVNFKSKRYKYGFVSNIPYDKLINNKLVGYNSEIIKGFSKLANIEVTYHEYKTYADLIKAFNENKIDFFFNQTTNKKYAMDIIETPSIKNEEIVVLSNIKNDMVVNSINSLKGSKVLVINNSKIAKYLKENNIDLKKYDNMEKLLNQINKNSIIVIDEPTYEMYKSSKLKDYEIDYNFKLKDSYNYVSRDIKDNRLFNNYFSFYLTFMNTKNILNKIDYKTFETANKLAFLKPLLFTTFAIVCLIVITIMIKFIKNHKNSEKITKEDKLRYIDMLTSLKNRNYLNDSMEKWDTSEVYPQTIIIIDLNNVAYINDNYGHNEGDNVIKEAANILIKNQQEQSEIIRTNGNEFLIYLVGYDEKQIVTYIKKLNKEMKELEHGFGAAIGYSMINDAIKSVDDAINEATLDMKTNKEETQE